MLMQAAAEAGQQASSMAVCLVCTEPATHRVLSGSGVRQHKQQHTRFTLLGATVWPDCGAPISRSTPPPSSESLWMQLGDEMSIHTAASNKSPSTHAHK